MGHDLDTPAPYTSGMAPSPNSITNVITSRPHVGILIFEDEERSGAALRQILDSEGCRVRVVPDVKLLQTELKTAEYSLLIANAELVSLGSPLFHVLRELGTVSVEDGARLRVLFVVPELGAQQIVAQLEEAKLPHVQRPFHLHDFLEKVSDLLVEVKAIEGPLRMTRYEFGAARKKKKAASKVSSMFASRESYTYTEEELAEYERQEAETSLARKKPRRDLGDTR